MSEFTIVFFSTLSLFTKKLIILYKLEIMPLAYVSCSNGNTFFAAAMMIKSTYMYLIHCP